MTINVGIIGVGMIGQDHIRRLTQVLPGAAVVAVTDVNAEQAENVAAGVPGAKAFATGQELIANDSVDAIVVCSWGPTHEEYVLAAIGAGKPVFCEKPLATTQEACLRIIEAEVRLRPPARPGRLHAPLRRRLPGHEGCRRQRRDRQPIDHVQRPPQPRGAPALHQGDGDHQHRRARHRHRPWLLGEEIVSAQVLKPRKNSLGGDLEDPLLTILETKSGALIQIETNVNIRYGYDIRGEIVGEQGTVSLAESTPVIVRRGGTFSGRVTQDWRERFIRAYDIEFAEWLDAVASGGEFGPSSWDGYAAAVVTDAAVQALHSGQRVDVTMPDKPALYAR